MRQTSEELSTRHLEAAPVQHELDTRALPHIVTAYLIVVQCLRDLPSRQQNLRAKFPRKDSLS